MRIWTPFENRDMRGSKANGGQREVALQHMPHGCEWSRRSQTGKAPLAVVDLQGCKLAKSLRKPWLVCLLKVLEQLDVVLSRTTTIV